MHLLQIPDFSRIDYLVTWLILSGVIFLRYLIMASAYHKLVFQWLERRRSERVIQHRDFDAGQMKMEVWRSGLSSFIFSGIAILMLVLYKEDLTLVYEDWSQYPIWYHPLSIFLVLFAQDTYYYWLHRWMHRPRIYKLIHKWHHDSVQTNSMTSFSFHPMESLLQAILFPILLLIIPIHLYSLISILIFMTITAIINHGAVEVYPQSRGLRWIQKWIIGATHHDVHHRRFLSNYGLYFTFWDRWMGTEEEVQKGEEI